MYQMLLDATGPQASARKNQAIFLIAGQIVVLKDQLNHAIHCSAQNSLLFVFTLGIKSSVLIKTLILLNLALEALSPAHIICPPCWPVFQSCRSPCVCWTYLDSTSCVGPLPGLCSLLGMFFSHMAVQLASFLSGLRSKAAPSPSNTSLLGSLPCSLALQSAYHALALKSSVRLVIIWLLTLECNDSTLCLLSTSIALCIKSILLSFHKKWQAWGQ